jgi:hypothetical protein
VDGVLRSGIDLHWIPLGAGGNGYVRLNGRLYETVQARLQKRRPLDLYHTALTVHVTAGRFAIECGWPSPDPDTASRGVTLEGPVFSRRLARFRPFRYEVRRWRDGVIPDLAHAVGGAQTIGRDAARAEHLLDLVSAVPAFVWGRDEAGAGEMWNSNSVISWLLASAGVPLGDLRPPDGGRAPGWQAGIAVAGAVNLPD